ncbi:hypothetical protein O3M35_013292 [Rhynocoris fuscipes]|uniref:Uncharacterized protein n=1 Tax=Rhynocoris fuscipes TaxID=488301 RepID=A0AAW1CG94_9HEMI
MGMGMARFVFTSSTLDCGVRYDALSVAFDVFVTQIGCCCTGQTSGGELANDVLIDKLSRKRLRCGYRTT